MPEAGLERATAAGPVAAGPVAAAAAEPLVARLAADVLAVAVETEGDAAPHLRLWLGGEPAPLRLFAHRYASPEGGVGHLLVAILDDAALGAGEPDLSIALGLSAAEHDLQAPPLRAPAGDLRELLRRRLAVLAAADRAAVLALLEEVAGADLAPRDLVGLGHSRALAREGLRDSLPANAVERDRPQGLQFDTVLALGDDAFYLRGWARDRQSAPARLTAVSPEGSRIELLASAHREPRADVDSFYADPTRTGPDGTGFIAYGETAGPSLLGEGWVLELENELGIGCEVPGPSVTRDLHAARTTILADLAKESRWDTALMDHVAPAITRLQERLERGARIEEVRDYGDLAADPEVSIVVPLYGRIDFLEHQLAQFVHDPELRRGELIYVLDSPELAGALAASAGQLFELYGLPFRVVVLSQNGGYSVANNRGASLARGRRLLLLNSDVLPAAPGWLGAMAAFYDAQPGIGALGPKLLFEDDTLQHAGIRFQRPPGGGAWENEHYFKGLHRDLPAANLTRRVPAVSGAAMMVDRELFADLGGLRGSFIQGDYEDTDLCLRLHREGRETWYLPEVELYHLEGQSYALETRQAMSRYNTWLHTRLWDEEIAALMEVAG
ncbi:MAG: glycosyltransferase family 2 protein [Actinobacteria bacterium]|nr:glycosyltransferase family 2 protein [Actinomycetota bacterium]